MMGTRFLRLVFIASLLSLSLLACTGRRSAKTETRIRWWHINTNQSSIELYDEISREFEAANPGVRVEATSLENMEYKSKLKLEFAADDPPDVFHSWGGGELAEQARMGYLRDITAQVRSAEWKSKVSEAALALYSYEGRVYGFPHDLGAVGFWYNSQILRELGYEEFPSRWEDFLELCEALKARGITPIALGVADRWPVMYWWVYLALRLNGPGLFEAILDGARSFSDQSLVEAGLLLRDLYLKGYLPDTALGDDFPTQSRLMGDGMCAMQLMGQWALAVQAQNATRKGELVPLMRFAPFPVVEGGKGSVLDVIGGGNGFVVGRNAPDEAVALLEYYTRAENLQRSYAVFPSVPTVAEVKVDNPGLNMVKTFLVQMESYCLYPDQMFSPETNKLINEVAARIMIGEISALEGGRLLDQSHAENR